MSQHLDKEDLITLFKRGCLSVTIVAGYTFLQLRELENHRDWFHKGLVNHHVKGGTVMNRLGQLYLGLSEEYEDNLFTLKGISWYDFN